MLGKKRQLMGRDNPSDGQQVVDATLFQQVGKMAVEGVRFNAALQYVAEDERALAAFLFGAAVHKVEGDVEAREVAVVGVVDERAVVLTVLHLQSHCHRFQGAQTLLDGVVVESQFPTGGAAQRLVVLEGVPCARTGNQLALQVALPDAFLYHGIASRIDDDLCILH